MSSGDMRAKAKPPAEAEMESWGRLAESAQPGPWNVGHAAEGLHGPFCCVAGQDGCHNVWADGGADVTTPCARLSHADAAFIACAREAVPRLLAAVAERDGIIADMAYESDAVAEAVRLRARVERLEAGLRRALEIVEAYPGDSPEAELEAVELAAREALGEHPPA